MYDYYQNQKEEQKKRKKRKIKLFIFLFFLILILAGVGWLLHSDVFAIKNVDVSGNKLVQSDKIISDFYTALNNNNEFWHKIFYKNSLTLANLEKNEIISYLKIQNPAIKDITWSSGLFSRSISINTQERDEYGLWCSQDPSGQGNKCLWFDSEGVAFMNGPDTEGSLIKRVISTQSADVGSYVLDQEYRPQIFSIFDFMNRFGVPDNQIYLKDLSLAQVEVNPQNYPKILFSLRFSPFFALKALENVKDKVLKSEYIDLTVNNRIYYK